MTRANLEALLFVSAKALTVRELSKLLDASEKKIDAWLDELAELYAGDDRGVCMVRSGNEVQIFTAPATREFVEQYLKEEITGELTRPQLETLTIIAYRGPISKPDIEQIRGINCTVIARNLLWRGLIEEADTSSEEIPVYQVTMEFIRYLGLTGITRLPEYERLHLCEISLPSSH